MISNIGPVAMAVLVLLLFASLYSWTVILGKTSPSSKATRESQRFIRAFRKATRLQEIAALATECQASPLAQVFESVYETYKRQTGGSGPPRNLAPLERSAQTAASEAVTNLERRLTWLATIGAVSPFVGLFGTVMGWWMPFTGWERRERQRCAPLRRALRGADHHGGGLFVAFRRWWPTTSSRRGSGSLPRPPMIFAGSC
jgi:biopolymer transport protein ExbB/TolQ